ncbi:thiamine phosphate synthase [Bartonella apis]|uniref:Thiamine-phosphate pyrophosphorylase n=1 Tax=Bartonella apis TaxID=1686310 RepID=A0A1R0FAZ9_9HYPH|nr:thiamine phosphate synthase [Bartonella apis]MCT6824632.1 thiamine phosphate synthase [Bartonella apis]MCT6861314.1 thiamine phosphate synthase [Bartonella apis]MCT6886661.1 thiamine phosphate synthase [Bartonella apis]OLY44163.1 thiamine-phosphate pyrophosphorylase [Bartonella apis]
MSKDTNRLFPRLVMTLDMRRNIKADFLMDVLDNGDFASLIVYDSQNDPTFLQQQAELLVDRIEAKSVAFLVANDSRIAGRIHADGIHLEGKVEELRSLLDRRHNSMIVGFGNLRDKHTAMTSGECEPDYLMFGKLGADKKPAPHPRNITLSSWWAEVMEIPAIVQAGSDIATFPEVLATKAEFIAVEEMIFGHDNPQHILREITRLIEESGGFDGELVE